MKLGIVNGSPRGKKSNSDKILNWLTANIKNEIEINEIYTINKNTQEELSLLFESDYIVFIFPLYTDSMPACTKAFMEKMEQNKTMFNNKPIAFIIHSGFPEAIHSRSVERYVKYFSRLIGMNYMGTVVMGGSEALQAAPESFFKKQIKHFNALGMNVKNIQPLDKDSIKNISKVEKLGLFQKIIMKMTFISDYYWNSAMKRNGVFENKYDRPYISD